MANWCDFRMMVRGKSECVDAFYRYLTDYDNSPKYFARIFDANIENESVDDNGTKTMRIFGCCAWSVYSCMCEGSYTYYTDGHRTDPKLTCLREATEALKLEVEIRSEEPGFGFWEHFHFKEGECLCEDTGDLMSETFDMEDAA
ncbi:MAG: hypothetical protein K5751_04220 [Treponemataceae bacterium]|nr:hypothetical protein [Treponemataceae bacterium]